MGFTLIELLVVVLIIGILATVAVPQYQVAVAKSKYATLKSLVNSIANAEEIYYLTNNEYTSNYEDLDIQMPENKKSDSTSTLYKYDWGACTLTKNRIGCYNTTVNLGYYKYYLNLEIDAGTAKCKVISTTDVTDWRNKICQTETGKSNGTVSSSDVTITYDYPFKAK